MTTRESLPPPPSLDALLAQAPTALFLDFDGTLVEIADTPDGIAVPDRLGEALIALQARLEGRLALVSGRTLDDLARHLGTLAIAQAGSHGAHRRLADGTDLGSVPTALDDAVIAALSDFAAAHSAVSQERKSHGAALHFRADPSVEPDVIAFLEPLAAAHGLAIKRGKCVAELVRPGANKGAAVKALCETPLFAGATPVFIGDDVTDEDGFVGAGRAGGFGIRVGPPQDTAARYALPDPQAVHQWLGWSANL